MGTDIHLHVEVKAGGLWQHHQAPRVFRNYQLFSMMAGVRGYETPIAPPRGLPDDISADTADAYRKDRGKGPHTASWLSSAEVRELERRWSASIDGRACTFTGGMIEDRFFGGCYSDEPERRGVEDMRFVFWFDC